MEETQKRIGIFKLAFTPDKKGYIGAFFVMDYTGKPEELRVTFPVKPSSMQRVLYGASLIPHIGLKLCAIPLYETLTNVPPVVLVEDERFLPLSDIAKGYVFAVRPYQKARLPQNNSNFPTLEITIDPADENFTKVRVIYPASYDDMDRDIALREIRSIARRMDLLEPFERVGRALAVLSEEDERFR